MERPLLKETYTMEMTVAEALSEPISPSLVEALKKETFRRVFEAAVTSGVHAVIAGGAAVDFRRASDVDVFVLDTWPAVNRFCEAIGVGGLSVDRDGLVYVGDDRGQFFRAAKFNMPWCPKPIHVIGWQPNDGDASTVRLLETFDLSIHAWAIDERGSLIACDNSTTLKTPISVIRMTPTTPERLVKLTERYFPPLTHTYASLTRSTEPMWRADRHVQ